MSFLDKFKKTKTDDQPTEAQSLKVNIEAEEQADQPKEQDTVKKVDKKAEKLKPKTTVKKDSKEKSGKKSTYPFAHRVLIKPLITEKVTDMGVENKYAFVVNGKTNKIEVKKAIRAMYNVAPIDVNIVNVKGKKVRFGRAFGKRSDWKKAIVQLKKGDTIEVYSGV